MSSNTSLEVLEFKVDRLEKNLSDIQLDQKEDRKILLENVVRQTVLMEKMEQRAERQDQRLDKMDEKLDQVNVDIQTIIVSSGTKQGSNKQEESEEKSMWYQTYISSNTKYFWIILILILGSLLGMKANEILAFLQKGW